MNTRRTATTNEPSGLMSASDSSNVNPVTASSRSRGSSIRSSPSGTVAAYSRRSRGTRGSGPSGGSGSRRTAAPRRPRPCGPSSARCRPRSRGRHAGRWRRTRARACPGDRDPAHAALGRDEQSRLAAVGGQAHSALTFLSGSGLASGSGRVDSNSSAPSGRNAIPAPSPCDRTGQPPGRGRVVRVDLPQRARHLGFPSGATPPTATTSRRAVRAQLEGREAGEAKHGVDRERLLMGPYSHRAHALRKGFARCRTSVPIRARTCYTPRR